MDTNRYSIVDDVPDNYNHLCRTTISNVSQTKFSQSFPIRNRNRKPIILHKMVINRVKAKICLFGLFLFPETKNSDVFCQTIIYGLD